MASSSAAAARVSRRALARAVVDLLVIDKSTASESQTTNAADGSKIMQALGLYLVKHRMPAQADIIMNDIAEELQRRTGTLSAEVASAHPLQATTRNELIQFLQDRTGASDVRLHETVDESLIGGLIARTPSAELDTSIQSRLNQLRAIV